MPCAIPGICLVRGLISHRLTYAMRCLRCVWFLVCPNIALRMPCFISGVYGSSSDLRSPHVCRILTQVCLVLGLLRGGSSLEVEIRATVRCISGLYVIIPDSHATKLKNVIGMMDLPRL